MKMRFIIDGQNVTRNKVKDIVGEERLNKMIEETKETLREDPLIECDYFLGSAGMLTIQADPWA